MWESTVGTKDERKSRVLQGLRVAASTRRVEISQYVYDSTYCNIIVHSFLRAFSLTINVALLPDVFYNNREVFQPETGPVGYFWYWIVFASSSFPALVLNTIS